MSSFEHSGNALILRRCWKWIYKIDHRLLRDTKGHPRSRKRIGQRTHEFLLSSVVTIALS